MKIFVCLALLILSGCAANLKSVETPRAPSSVVDSSEDKKNWLNVPIGPSAPQDSSGNAAITRQSGGEPIALVFLDSATKKPATFQVLRIRLVGFSKSGKGSILVRKTTTQPDLPTRILAPLVDSGSVEPGTHAKDQKGTVLLGNGDFVTLTPQDPISLQAIGFTLEAFGDNDASVYIQFLVSVPPSSIAVSLGRPRHEPAPRSSSSGNETRGGNPNQNTCRADGYQCSNSAQCCSRYCQEGYCYGGGGGSCRGAGAACSNSAQCCSRYCQEGYCYDGGGGSCRGAGARCENSIQCCSRYCQDNVCYGQ